MLVYNFEDIIDNLNIILNNNIFKQSLSDARNNWLNIPIEEVIGDVIGYFKETIMVKEISYRGKLVG